MERNDGGREAVYRELPNVSDEKSDHTVAKGKLQSPQIPEIKW